MAGIVDELNDRGIVLEDGTQLSYTTLSRIMRELGNANLLRSLHLLESDEVEFAALAFGTSSTFLGQMAKIGSTK